MISQVIPRTFLPCSRAERLVVGLRDYEKPTECIVYRLNPDGTKGELLRIENPDLCNLPYRFNNEIK